MGRAYRRRCRLLGGAAWSHRPLPILVDGPSGAGKTSFARALASGKHFPRRQRSLELVSMDSLYPGWEGLLAGVRLLDRHLLRPWEQGRPGFCRAHHWDPAHPQPADIRVPAAALLLVEGCGAFGLNPGFPALRVWVDAEYELRRCRALLRDASSGSADAVAGGYALWWDMWQQQWERYQRRYCPERQADLRLSLADGSS